MSPGLRTCPPSRCALSTRLHLSCLSACLIPLPSSFPQEAFADPSILWQASHSMLRQLPVLLPSIYISVPHPFFQYHSSKESFQSFFSLIAPIQWNFSVIDTVYLFMYICALYMNGLRFILPSKTNFCTFGGYITLIENAWFMIIFIKNQFKFVLEYLSV